MNTFLRTPEFDAWLKGLRDVIYLLLCGGGKSSQRKDIRLAKNVLGRLESP